MNKLKGKITPVTTVKGNISTAKVYPELEDLTVIPSFEEQNFKSERYGYNNVKVKAIEGENLEVTPSIEEQNFNGIFTEVKANSIQAEELIVTSNNEEQIKEGLFNKVIVKPVEVENIQPMLDTQNELLNFQSETLSMAKMMLTQLGYMV